MTYLKNNFIVRKLKTTTKARTFKRKHKVKIQTRSIGKVE